MLKSILAGAAATRAMTDAMNNANKVGLAKVDIASIIGSIFNQGQSATPHTPHGVPAWPSTTS